MLTVVFQSKRATFAQETKAYMENFQWKDFGKLCVVFDEQNGVIRFCQRYAGAGPTTS